MANLNVSMGTCDDLNSVPILLALQDHGIVFGCQHKHMILALSLQHLTIMALDVNTNMFMILALFLQHLTIMALDVNTNMFMILVLSLQHLALYLAVSTNV